MLLLIMSNVYILCQNKIPYSLFLMKQTLQNVNRFVKISVQSFDHDQLDTITSTGEIFLYLPVLPKRYF